MVRSIGPGITQMAAAGRSGAIRRASTRPRGTVSAICPTQPKGPA